jgi:hypothetical protein
MSIATPWPHGLNAILALALLVGLAACGSPAPDGPWSGSTSAARQAPTPASPLGPPETAAERRSPDAPRATSPAPAAAPADPPPSDAQPPAEQAQQEARERWFAEARENPDATIRLQALEVWAQQPGDDIEPVLEALGDEDEAVQARAEALWEQQLAREEAAAL